VVFGSYSHPFAHESREEIIKKYDLSCLRHLASVGEPLNSEAVIWSERVFGKPFLDTYWQTETGSIMISNYPGMKIKPGSMGKPFPGITACVLDIKTYEPIQETGKIGLIGFKPGWPSMMRMYWNNEETYKNKFKKRLVPPRRPLQHRQRRLLLVCRSRRRCHQYRWSPRQPFEVESALLENEMVAESAVVSKPDDINMEVVKAFVTLKPGFEANKDTELMIMNFIRKSFLHWLCHRKSNSFPHYPKPAPARSCGASSKQRNGRGNRRYLHFRGRINGREHVSTCERVNVNENYFYRFPEVPTLHHK